MQETFTLLQAPHLGQVDPFRFVHARVRGPYHPWARVQALDTVAEALERTDVERTGPAFGVYHDLPATRSEPEAWTADLGWPVAPRAKVPTRPGLRVRALPGMPVAALRYRGNLTSFPDALRTLVEWCEEQGLDPAGCLMERFHVSDAITGIEERDVFLALEPVGL